MSHNKITVQSQNPDSSGNISLSSLNIGDLNNVTITSPTANQVIKYDGAGYINSDAPAGVAEYILIGRGESDSYSNSGAANFSNGTEIRIYDTAPDNTITGATLNQHLTSNWYKTVTLPIGIYFVIAQFSVEFSASGYLAAELTSSTGVNYSMRAIIGDNANVIVNGGSTTITGVFELTAISDLELRITNNSNVDTIANQGNKVSEQTYLYIQKV